MALWEAELATSQGVLDPLVVVPPLVARFAQVPDPRQL
jgi:hypothetical protein